MDQDTIEGVVQSQIENPRPASPEDVEVYMPANLVEGEDAEDVAAYVASVAGVPGIEPPEFIAARVLRHQLRRLPHAERGRHHGHDRPEPRRRAPGPEPDADLRVDHRPRGPDLVRLPPA